MKKLFGNRIALAVAHNRIDRGMLTRRILHGLTPMLLLLITIFLYDQVQAFSDLHVSDLAALELTPGMRLLVISPHPDDEMLSSGGVIQRVLETGGQVEIVMITNGDGQYFGPLIINGKIRSQPADYIRMGQTRQKETLKALSEIGLNSDQVIFLLNFR